ncbi:MAG: regulatory protein RecX [Pseudomonadota bacterium]
MIRSINELNSDLFEDSHDDRSRDPKAVRKKAMDLLARREYGFAELVGRLRGAGFDDDVASSAVTVLSDEGLQDDQRFAESFARSKLGRGSGPLRIRQALLEKGLAESLVERTIADLDTDWISEARQVRAKKFGGQLPAEYTAQAKQMRFLQYRGFDHEQIRAAMRRVGD